MEELLTTMADIGVGQIATVVGRYWAMDRDKRWDRVEKAIRGLVLGEGEATDDPLKTVKERYEKGGDMNKDEFLTPIIVGGDESRMKGWWCSVRSRRNSASQPSSWPHLAASQPTH